MDGHAKPLPDWLIPYCSRLYEHFQVEIAEDPQKRDAIIWAVDLLRMKDAYAQEVLHERQYRVDFDSAPTVPEQNVAIGIPVAVDAALSGNDSEPDVPAISTGHTKYAGTARWPVSNVSGLACRIVATSAALDQPPAFSPSLTHVNKTINKESRTRADGFKKEGQVYNSNQRHSKSLQPSSPAATAQRFPLSTAPHQTITAEDNQCKPCVGDWKCKQCKLWNKLFHEKCRTRDEDANRDCDGARSFPDDVECVQEDDGRAKHNKMGRYKGYWYSGECEFWNFETSKKCRVCTTLFSEAEYVMGNDDFLENAPPPRPRSGKTDREKREAYFRSAGRFMTPKKRGW